MNKIFKVIWSKSKQCYVVVSEMAKNTTGKKKIIVASILAGLAMSTMGTNVMAVSSIPFSDKPSSALGNGSVKPGTTNGVAIGNAAYSDSHQSIAIGFRSLASGTFLGGSIKPSVAVGAGAHAEGNNTVAIGTVAENRASYGVSLGNESKVTSGSDYGIAIGYQTQVSAVHSMAIGEKANASATLAIALGANAKATGAYSYTAGFNSESGGEAAIAVGKSASAGGASAVAVGNGTVATGSDTVAIGTSSQASGSDAVAIGKNANASNGDSIAIGQDTVSNNLNSVALGKTSKATGASATALGPQAQATGSTAVAIGLNSEANTSATVAIGQSSAASGLQAIAVGYKSAASGDNAAAYGNTAKAVGKNSLALGANTQAPIEGGVALGAGSIANTVAGAGYNPNTGRSNTYTPTLSNAMTSTWAAVSIGDGTNTRQLTGLAAGSKDTDAVNVAQLKSMNLAFTADGSTKGDVNLTNSALNVVGDSTYITTKGNNQTLTISAKKQNITVSNGTASASAGMADANNVAQAINQANADQTISYKANGGTANTVKVSDGLNFTNGASTVATVGANGQVTYDLNTTTKQSITDSSTAVNRTIALGSDSGSTTAKKLSTSAIAFNIKGDTGANALITTTATGDNVSITPTAKLTAAVVAAENAANKNLSNISSSGETVIKNLAKGAAQDAVKVAGTGLATVSDNTTGGVKTYTVNVDEGKLVLDDTTGKIGAYGSTQGTTAGKNGVATTQNVATAINDAITKSNANTAQALADAEHKFDGDTGTTSVRKHGEVLSIKGGVTNAADLATGNIGVVSDGAGTLNIRLAKVLSGLTSATFTTAGGNTTVINGDGVTITPSGTGASAISMTTDGINAGGTEIKNIADGTAATSAVSKGQMETAIANAQTAATSTEKVVAKTLSGDTNLATVTGQTGTAKGETYEVAVSENAVKNVAKAAAQDAVTVTGTGLATVSDNTTGGVKTYTVNVDEGKLVLDDTTGKIGANGSTQGSTAGKNGVATTQNVATAINDAVTKANANNAQALADAKHNFAGDDATVISRKHGEQLNIKGGASTTATDLTSGNIAVVGDTTSGTLNIKMAKALTGLTSATFTDGSGNTQTVTGASSTITDGAGNTTAITKGGVTTTDAAGNTTTTAPTGVTVTPAGAGATPISVTTSGISAGNKEVKNVANGTTDDAAVNKKQMDDALKGATDNTVSLGSESGTTTAKKLSTTGGIKFNIKGDTGANALITTSATGDNVTIAPTAKLTAAVTAAEKSADKDLSNISSAGKTVIKDLAVTSAQDAVNVTGTGLATVSDNTTGGVKTYTVNVDEGKLVLDDTTGKIGANGSTQGTTAGKNGVATTQNVATAINDAITKSNANTAQALADAEHKFDGDTGTTSVRKHGEVLSIKGGVTTPADLTTGNIGVVSDGAGTLNIRLAKVLSGLTSATFKDASGNTTMVTGGSTTIADTAGNTQTLAPTKSEIKDNNGVSTVTTKDGVTAKDASGQTTSLTKGGVDATDGNGNTTSLTNTGVSATDGNGHTTGLTNGGLSTTDGTNTTTVAPTGITATDGTNTVKLNGSGIDAGNTEIKNVGKATTDDAAVNKKQMDDAITKATADATHEFAGDTGNNSVRKHGEVLSIKGGVTTPADLTTGNIGVVSDGAGTLNIRLAKVLSGLTSATFKDASGNTTMVTGGSTTIADTAGNTQTLAPTKSEIKDTNGVSTVTTKDGVTAKDASGQTTSLTKGGVDATDGNGNTTSLTNTGVSATDGNGHTTGLTNGGLSTTDGTNTTTVAPTGITATDGTNTVKLNGSGIDAGNTEIKNVGKATTDDAAVNKKQMDDAITKATADATHEFGGDDATVVSRKHGEKLTIKGGATTTDADLTSGNIAVIGDATNGALNIKLAKALTGLTSATFTDTAGNTTTVTGGSTTIADTAGNTQTLAPTKSEIKDTNGVSTVTTKDGVTAKDASGQTTSLTKGGVDATDGNGNTTSLTNTGVSATDGNGHTTGLTNGGLSTTDGTNTTTVAPTGITATDGTNTVKLNGSGIDAGNTEIKNVGKATTDDAAVNKKQMDDAITKATADATHDFAGDDATVISRKHGEQLNIKGGASTTATDLTSGNIAVIGDTTTGTLNIKLAKVLTGLTSATFTDTSGNTTTVTGGSTTIADTSGNTQTLAPTKSEIKDNNGVSTVTTKDGVTAKDASGQTTSLTKGGVDATDGNGNTTSLTNTGVSATDGNGHTTGLTNGGLSTTDGTNTTTVAPTGMTATDGTNTVKVEGSGIDAGGTEIKHIAAGTAADSAVNKGQMDDAITKATADATHEFAGDTGSNSVRKHGEVLSIKGGVTDTNKLSDNNIGVISDGAGTLNVKLSKDLTGLTSATFKDRSGNTQTVTGASSTITDGTGNTTAMTKGGLSTTDGTNTTTIAPTGVTATDGTNIVKLNGSGIDAGNTQIKNVGKATTDDAAVNKKQMDEAVKAASDATKALGNNTISLGGDSGSKTTAKTLNTTGGIQFNIKGQTGTDALITTSASGDDVTITPTDKLINAVKAAEKSADKDLSNLSAAGNTHIQNLAKSAASWNVQTNGNGTTAVVGGDTVNFINGDNIAITNTGHAITIGTAKDVSFDKVTVGGMTLDKNGILSGISSITGSGTGAPTMTFNSQNGNTPANVSINSNLDMGGHRITGVGPAEKPTDAVNKQQVDQALRGLAGLADNAARQYASKAGANAAALAALKPIQYDPLEPTQIMAGVGNYKSQTAVALGMAHYTNENTMFNIGVSLDSHDNMVNAGVTHKFGYSPEKKAIPDRYKGGPISSIYVMQDEMQALLAKDQEKDAVISKQASEIDTLRQQNEDMQRKIDMILAKLQ